jgi:hypothetical protein
MLRCEDCRRESLDKAIERGWISRWLKRDDGESVVLFYCPKCAEQFAEDEDTSPLSDS